MVKIVMNYHGNIISCFLIDAQGVLSTAQDSILSLLTFDEYETFLHEFGHCLHGIFAE